MRSTAAAGRGGAIRNAASYRQEISGDPFAYGNPTAKAGLKNPVSGNA